MTTNLAQLALMRALGRDERPSAKAWAKLVPELKPQDELGLFLLAMTCDGDLIEPVAQAQRWELRSPSGPKRLASMHIDRPEVERALDRALASGHLGVAADLVRARVPWTHDALQGWLDQPERRSLAALLLAAVDPELVQRWCVSDAPQRARDLIEPLRALAMVDSSEALHFLRSVREELEEEEERDALKVRERLDGLIAVADPVRFARGVMMDELELGWLRRPEAVADVLAVHGTSSWLETLACLEIAQTMTAFEFAALLAVTASTSARPLADDDEVRRVVDLIQALRDRSREWEGPALELDLPIPLGLGDEDLTPLLIEVASHERLLASGLPSWGIVGLPLSATLPEALDLDAASDLLSEAHEAQSNVEDEAVVCAVRTLLDLRLWHERDPQVVASLSRSDLLDALAEHANGAINLAARRALAALGRPKLPSIQAPLASARDAMSALDPWTQAPQVMAQLAREETLIAAWAMQQASLAPWPQGVLALGRAWLDCSPHRSGMVLDMVAELCAARLDALEADPWAHVATPTAQRGE